MFDDDIFILQQHDVDDGIPFGRFQDQDDEDDGTLPEGAAIARIKGRLGRLDSIPNNTTECFMWLFVEDEFEDRDGDLRPGGHQALKIRAKIMHLGSLMHADLETYRAHRADAELEAESVSFIIMHQHGINSGSYAFGYAAAWAGGGDAAIKALKVSAQRIQTTAKTIIDGIEQRIEVEHDGPVEQRKLASCTYSPYSVVPRFASLCYGRAEP